MDVILLERIERLGQMGDVVTVKNGYARNFLLPKKKALRANKANKVLFENQRADLETRNLERRSEAEQVAIKAEGLSIVLVRQAGESGQLYGSVSARDIAAGLNEASTLVERSQVALDRPIKLLGLHEVRISLHPEVSISVQVNVARTVEEAELQAQGRSLTDDDEDQFAAEELFATQADEDTAEQGDSEEFASDESTEDKNQAAEA